MVKFSVVHFGVGYLLYSAYSASIPFMLISCFHAEGEICFNYDANGVVLCNRGGKICMTDHFKPLWARNVPKFGIGHAMALGVSCCSLLHFVVCLNNKYHNLPIFAIFCFP